MTNCVFESLRAGLRPLDFKFIFGMVDLRVTTLQENDQFVDDKSVILDQYFTSNQKLVELLQLVAHYVLAATRVHSMAHVILNDEPKKPTDLYGMAHFCHNVAHHNLLQSYLDAGYYNSGHDDNLMTLVCYATQITICVSIETTKVKDVYKHHNSSNPHQIDLSFSDSHCAFLKRT
jgi:hypothetical protein